MSITSIYFENYKAFKSGEIKLDKLSVLLGTNSSGKSSIIKLILMLSQSSSSNNKNLLINGSLSDLGEYKNIFHNQDTSKDLKIEFKISDIKISDFIQEIKQNIHEILNTTLRTKYYSAMDYLETKDVEKINQAIEHFHINAHSLEEKISIVKSIIRRFPIKLNDEEKKKRHSYNNEYENITETNLNSLLGFFNELKKLDKINSFGYTISYYKNELIIRNIYLKKDKSNALSIDFINWKTKRKQISFASDIIDCKKINKEKTVNKNNLGTRALKLIWGDTNINKSTMRSMSTFIKHGISYIPYLLFNSILRDELREITSFNIKHVGPLRFAPKRFFLIDNNTSSKIWNTSDGEKLSSILHKNHDVKTQINNWLKIFDLEVNIDQIQDIIHSIKIKDKGINLDITDVGFGISQVLPVILQPYLSSNNGIIIIEQPEVHIHPKMQSELADFFISIIKKSNKRFIIETHSEAFLKRLRRRISEYSEKLDTSISYKDVAIQFIEKRENKKSSATIKNIDISPSGMFEWPKDFKENDVEDSIEFMKRQG